MQMIAWFFEKSCHVLAIPIEDRNMVTVDWYVNHCMSKVLLA